MFLAVMLARTGISYLKTIFLQFHVFLKKKFRISELCIIVWVRGLRVIKPQPKARNHLRNTFNVSESAISHEPTRKWLNFSSDLHLISFECFFRFQITFHSSKSWRKFDFSQTNLDLLIYCFLFNYLSRCIMLVIFSSFAQRQAHCRWGLRHFNNSNSVFHVNCNKLLHKSLM